MPCGALANRTPRSLPRPAPRSRPLPIAETLEGGVQITTASSLAAMVDLLLQGQPTQRGFVRQVEVPLAALLGNRFGPVHRHQA